MLDMPIGRTNICLFKSSLILFCKWDEFKKGAHAYKKLLISQKKSLISMTIVLS